MVVAVVTEAEEFIESVDLRTEEALDKRGLFPSGVSLKACVAVFIERDVDTSTSNRLMHEHMPGKEQLFAELNMDAPLIGSLVD